MAKRAARVGRKRPWTILRAPPAREWSEVVDELPSELGLELSMLARQVRLAAECAPGRRAHLFAETTARHVGERRTEALNEAPADLRPELRVLMRLTGRRPPEDGEVAAACEAVAEWAQDAGHPRLAVHFAEAGAAILPGEAYPAFIAARTNRIVGEPWRAEIFYSRAIRFAYQQQNWSVYVRARLGFGRLLADRGQVRAAAKHYHTAARVALDQGEEWLAAQTYHDLILLCFEQDDLESAVAYGQKALDTYPRHHERYPIAVHDLVFVLLISEHHYIEALPLLEMLTRAPLPLQDQVLVLGTLARTAGSLALENRFSDAEAVVLQLAPHYATHAAAAFLNLGFGARALGSWEEAEEYVRRGIELAEARQHRHVQSIGRRLLKELEERRPAPAPAPPLEGEPAERLRKTAALLESQLGSWRLDTWRKKENQSGPARLGLV